MSVRYAVGVPLASRKNPPNAGTARATLSNGEAAAIAGTSGSGTPGAAGSGTSVQAATRRARSTTAGAALRVVRSIVVLPSQGVDDLAKDRNTPWRARRGGPFAGDVAGRSGTDRGRWETPEGRGSPAAPRDRQSCNVLSSDSLCKGLSLGKHREEVCIRGDHN